MTVLIVVLLFARLRADGHRSSAPRPGASMQRRVARSATPRSRPRSSSTSPTRRRASSASRCRSAQARILAVDDEPVILDSFRRSWCSRASASTPSRAGPRRSGSCSGNDYDFVFTDLKMPGMDGVEVVKGVKHLRPDIDVAVITGYGTIESAVETMQHGAVDYVQKPFTADELTAFARQLLIKRQARLEAQRLPHVRVVAPAVAEAARADEFCVPGGAFVSDGHAWARIEASGQVRVGLDDFARKALGKIERVELPANGATVQSRRRRSSRCAAAARRSRFFGAALGPGRRRSTRTCSSTRDWLDAEPLRPRLGVPARAADLAGRARGAAHRQAGGRLVPGGDRPAAPGRRPRRARRAASRLGYARGRVLRAARGVRGAVPVDP